VRLRLRVTFALCPVALPVGEARLPEEMENLAKRYKLGEELSFTIEVDVYPQVPTESMEYKGLAVEVRDALDDDATSHSTSNQPYLPAVSQPSNSHQLRTPLVLLRRARTRPHTRARRTSRRVTPEPHARVRCGLGSGGGGRVQPGCVRRCPEEAAQAERRHFGPGAPLPP
jgi:hypothetical protein